MGKIATAASERLTGEIVPTTSVQNNKTHLASQELTHWNVDHFPTDRYFVT